MAHVRFQLFDMTFDAVVPCLYLAQCIGSERIGVLGDQSGEECVHSRKILIDKLGKCAGPGYGHVGRSLQSLAHLI